MQAWRAACPLCRRGLLFKPEFDVVVTSQTTLQADTLSQEQVLAVLAT